MRNTKTHNELVQKVTRGADIIKEKKLYEWLSVALLLIGATLLALNLPYSKWSFVILGVSRLCLSILMYRKKDYPMFVMNFFYLIVDIVGIIRWF